jgi:hypothetical protein
VPGAVSFADDSAAGGGVTAGALLAVVELLTGDELAALECELGVPLPHPASVDVATTAASAAYDNLGLTSRASAFRSIITAPFGNDLASVTAD